MSKILLMGDVHLGKNLMSHTTAHSRRRLQDEIFNKAMRVVNKAGVSRGICLGDLFDKYANDERTLLQGYMLAGRLDAVMAGNHDVVADNEKIGSLQALQKISLLGEADICIAPYGEVQVFFQDHGNCRFVMVPHHTTDELFEQALQAAVAQAGEAPRARYSKEFLLLHCNYDSGFATNDVTLNLPRKRAKELLEHFDHIVIGHDHVPKDDFDGRVIVIGNIHPTGFGDISDKRVLWVDDVTGEVSSELVWCGEDSGTVQAEHFLSPATFPQYASLEFLTIAGEIDADEAFDLAQAVKQVWASETPPFAIRVDVKLRQAGEQVPAAEGGGSTDAWSTIRGELQAAGRNDLLEILDGLQAAGAGELVEE